MSGHPKLVRALVLLHGFCAGMLFISVCQALHKNDLSDAIICGVMALVWLGIGFLL